jgi:hypothetical protein
MWESLGFRESPYNTDPLRARAEDIDLLVGRDHDANRFCTELEMATNGVMILSGAPGVGKTSFFNVQQYRLENGLTLFGPKVLSARQLCPVQPNDELRQLALRALGSLHRSVELWCLSNGRPIPKETKKLGRWLAGTGDSGFSIGVSVLGFGGNVGRSFELPKATDASFEAVTDAITAITAEVVNELGFDSAVIALDNLEHLEEKELASMLISFRDTLFATPHLWWVLIGQSGLGSLIQSLDPRVFERTAASMEIVPIELAEFDRAIALRVAKFHKSGAGRAPLSSETHRALFEASFGEMRFVFKYSNSICSRFVERLRSDVMRSDALKSFVGATVQKMFTKALSTAIAAQMINDQLPDAVATNHLKAIVQEELSGLFLKATERQVLNAIGKVGKARASDYKAFGLGSMQDFSSNYLSKLYRQNLLVRQQEGKAVNYRLRGVAQLAYQFGLLDGK